MSEQPAKLTRPQHAALETIRDRVCHVWRLDRETQIRADRFLVDHFNYGMVKRLADRGLITMRPTNATSEQLVITDAGRWALGDWAASPRAREVMAKVAEAA